MPTDRAKGDPFGAKAFVDDLLVFSQVRLRVRVRVSFRVSVRFSVSVSVSVGFSVSIRVRVPWPTRFHPS